MGRWSFFFPEFGGNWTVSFTNSNKPFKQAIYLYLCVSKFTLLGAEPYHKLCYKELHHPKCDVCLQFVRIISAWTRFVEEMALIAFHWNTPANKALFCMHVFLQIATNRAGLIEYRAHPFWGQKYCPSHELDRTPRCCSCEKMEVHICGKWWRNNCILVFPSIEHFCLCL
jgi:hypothetical protein